MASEIRVDKINSLSGVGTVTLSPTGVDIAGITTVSTLKVGTGVTASEDGDIFFTGIATATTFVGNLTGDPTGSGANLTALPAAQVTGTLPAISGANLTALNGSNIASGTVADARISTLTASKLSGALPAISALNLTNVPAANVVGVHTSLNITGSTTTGTAVVGGGVTISESGIAVAGAAVTASNFNGGQLGRRNLLINGNFMIAQRGTSSTTMNDYFVDRWRTYGGPSGFTISRQDDLTYPDGKYGIRMHRTNGNSQTNNHGVGQGVETKTSKIVAGKTVTLSFKARRGANFSASSNILTVTINGGEGTDENPFGMTNTNGTSLSATLSETAASYQLSFDVPSDKTQLTVMFSYTPSGTAGANDWFEVADCQLEVGEKTPFEILSEAEQLALCMRYYEGIIMGTGTAIMRTYTSTTNVTNVEYNYKVEKRASPTWSLEGNGTWNPSGNSGMNAYPSTSTCIFQRNDETAQYLSDANGDLCGSFSAEL